MAQAKYVKVARGFRLVRHWHEWRKKCGNCGAVQPESHHYDAEQNIVCAKGCGQVFYELTLPAPKPKTVAGGQAWRDARIRARLARAQAALENAIGDLRVCVRRVAAHQARIRRLEAALSVPAEQRSARARKALETRRQASVTRGMAVGGGKIG